MKYLQSELREFALQNPGTWDHILSAGKISPDGMHIDLDPTILETLKGAAHVDLPKPITPAAPALPAAIPRDEWPIWTKPLLKLARPGDRGLGDVAARMIAVMGGPKISEFLAKLGRDCRCEVRQSILNARYPLADHSPAAGAVTAEPPPRVT